MRISYWSSDVCSSYLPISYTLTRPSKALDVSTVSAEILHFVAMDDAPNRIRELRLAKRPTMSPQALGARIGVSTMTISDLERGEVRVADGRVGKERVSTSRSRG